MTARVLWWNVDRGHGFARTEEGEDVFLHHAAILDGEPGWRGEINPLPGQCIDFDPLPGTVGTVAASVRIVPCQT